MTPTSVELATSRNVHGESSSSRTDVVTGGSRVNRGESRDREVYRHLFCWVLPLVALDLRHCEPDEMLT